MWNITGIIKAKIMSDMIDAENEGKEIDSRESIEGIKIGMKMVENSSNKE